jgi:hypothetical protein
MLIRIRRASTAKRDSPTMTDKGREEQQTGRLCDHEDNDQDHQYPGRLVVASQCQSRQLGDKEGEKNCEDYGQHDGARHPRSGSSSPLQGPFLEKWGLVKAAVSIRQPGRLMGACTRDEPENEESGNEERDDYDSPFQKGAKAGHGKNPEEL